MLCVTFKFVCKLHMKRLSFCSWKLNFNKTNFSKRVTILNLFLFRRLRRNLIRIKSIKFQLIPIQFLVLEQMYMQMQHLNLHFLSPSSDLGKRLSTTSTELVLDMTRMCPFIF